MKQFWIGIGLLAVLLGLGIGAAWGMETVYSPVSGHLERASLAVMEENWAQAERCCHQAKKEWEQAWGLTAALANHTPMEEIDSLFSQMEVYVRCRDRAEFSACCASLSRLIRAMSDAHSLAWWNFL